jgi:hypothetical protein
MPSTATTLLVVKGTIVSNARSEISRLASTRGKGGAEESVKLATPYWQTLLKEEPSALPSEWVDDKGRLDAEKALTIYGAYICARYGLELSVVMNFSSVIKSAREDIEPLFSITKPDEFKSAVIALETKMGDDTAETLRVNNLTGVTAREVSKSALKKLSSITLGLTVGAEAVLNLKQIISHAEMLLEYAEQQAPTVIKKVASVA